MSNPIATSPKLPEKWSTTENIDWKAEIPGRGWSSPIVSGNRVFLTTVVTDGPSKKPQIGTEYSNEYAAELEKKGLSEQEIIAKINERDFELPHQVNLHYYLYCLDLRTGKVNWKQEFYAGHPPGGRHRKNSFTSETPVTDGKFVYVYVTNLGLYAYDFNGRQVWRTAMEALPIYMEFGTGASPALVGDLLIVVNDNEKAQFIAAYNKKDGKQVWKTARDLEVKRDGPPTRSAWVTPYVWTTPLRTEIVTVGPGTAVSYSLEGKELWRLAGLSPAPIPSPYAVDGLLYINGGRGRGLYAVKHNASGDLTTSDKGVQSSFVVWSQPRAGTYLPTQVAYQGAVYVLNETGIFTRLDAKTGKQAYKVRIEGGEAFSTSPWAYNGKVFCLNEEGKTFVVNAGDKYELVRVNNLDEMALATPAIVGDRLLLRTETKLYSIRNAN